MAKRNIIRILFLALPFLTAFSIPAGNNREYNSLTAPETITHTPMIPQDDNHDFGDAPESYGSADHAVANYYLGDQVDAEKGSQYSEEADGDDLNGIDDEDGVTIHSLKQGERATIRYTVFTWFTSAYLNAWIDWNGDGDFDDQGERVATDVRRGSGSYNLDVTVPSAAIASRATFARFRFGPRSTNDPVYSSTGSATSGEVEDYIVKIECSNPPAPRVGQVTQPSCDVATGSAVLENLPGTGTWTLIRIQDGEIVTGSGSTYTVTGLLPGTWNYMVTNQGGCSSGPSAAVTIVLGPDIPGAPVVGTITQPTCNVSTGSLFLSGLPASGSWTLTRQPDGATYLGSGTSTTLTGIQP